ncbi:MAG: DUF4367 domain-containing protein [Tissierellia bacterium]|nr:DUF4367 domain-containing protein [Tissierellia bacterium]
MKNKIEEKISKAVKSSHEMELEELSRLDLEKISYEILSPEKIEKLSKRILALPIDYKNILFAKYSFNLTPTNTEEIYEIKNAKDKLIFIKRLLANAINLEEKWIAEESLKSAVEIALIEYTKIPEDIIEKPKYTRSFKRTMREINIKVEKSYMRIVKRVAMFILVLGMTLSIVLGTNVKAREKLFGWAIEKFQEYSIFTPDKIDEDYVDKAEIGELKINYVPDGFELTQVHDLDNMIGFEYINKSGSVIHITFTLLSSELETKKINTEDSEIVTKETKGNLSYYWEKDGRKYAMWQQNGIECIITGELSDNEMNKIIENISK